MRQEKPGRVNHSSLIGKQGTKQETTTVERLILGLHRKDLFDYCKSWNTQAFRLDALVSHRAALSDTGKFPSLFSVSSADSARRPSLWWMWFFVLCLLVCGSVWGADGGPCSRLCPHPVKLSLLGRGSPPRYPLLWLVVARSPVARALLERQILNILFSHSLPCAIQSSKCDQIFYVQSS